MGTVSIALSILALIIAIINMLSSHILKEPPIINDVKNQNNNCSGCCASGKCLLKYYLIMNGKKMFEKIIKMQPIIICFSILCLAALILMVAFNLFVQHTGGTVLAQNDNGVMFFMFVLVQLILIVIPLLCYMYVRFYCFIFKNIGDL